MKIVKNKDFERDDTVKRQDYPDSPLRFPMHAQWAETHEERCERFKRGVLVPGPVVI